MTLLFSKIPLNSLNILAIDDEAFNLEILSEWLLDWGVDHIVTAENGRQALERLQAAKRPFDVILLDRMMPEMDGMELLAVLKTLPHRNIPVIMQSAAATIDEVQSALSAGVWYYLSKPFERRKLFSLIETAVTDSWIHSQLCLLVSESGFGENDHRPIELQTLAQAQEVAVRLAQLGSEPEKVVGGLFELLLNAIEHGNLEIGYHDKTRLLNNRQWMEEIETRLNRAPYCDRVVRVSVNETENQIEYTIEDEGKGFKSKNYMQLQTHRAADNHGRGIAFANICSFERLEFLGTGNRAHAFSNKGVG